MALVTRRQCDNCRSEIDILDPRYAFWWGLERNETSHHTPFAEHGSSDRFDFCSLPCITAWTHSRELIRTAS